MLTKEECIKASQTLSSVLYASNYNGNALVKSYPVHIKEMNIFRQLIEEHFSNPPLKFEELKEGMWIWDNNWNQYFEICEIYPQTKEFDVLIHQNRINKLRYEPMKFEENRFYRKQVE